MSGSKCERCVNDKSCCEQCIDNPVYQEILSKLKSYYMDYKPACPYGYLSCVNDPAYIKCYHPDWYKELYGEILPKETITTKYGCGKHYQKNNEFCCYYDDEDK